MAKKIEIGLQLYTVRDYIADRRQLEETLGKVKAAGYDIIQYGTPGYMSAGEFKALLDGMGMRTCSSSGDYEKMKSDLSAFRTAVEQAHALGVKFVGIGSIPVALRKTKEGFEQFAKDMNMISHELKKEGLKLSYHNHAFEFKRFGDCTGMDILTGETDPECVYFCIDTHWVQTGGKNPYAYIRSLKGRVTLVHYKDYSVDTDVEYVEQLNKHFAEVGMGNLDWPEIIEACRDSGTEIAVVEQDKCNGSPFDSIKISRDNLRKFGL